jgi:hypothetical protein
VGRSLLPKSPYITAREQGPPVNISREMAIKEMQKRGVDVSHFLVSDEEKAQRRAEILKCAGDCVYFIRNYVKTLDPRGAGATFVPFDLFPRQVELIRWLDERVATQTKGVVEKSRDTGVSWVLCSWLFHRWMFSSGFVAGLGSHKLEYVDQKGNPKSLFEKFRIILDGLPAWLIPPGFDRKKNCLENLLINPSIRSTMSGEGGDDIGRGGRSSVYFVDEYNKLEHPEMADAALSRNTNVILYVGTPNGLIGIYDKREIWDCFTLHWIDDPRYNRWEERSQQGKLIAEGVGRHPETPVPRCDSSVHRTKAGNRVEYPWYEQQKFEWRDKLWIIRQELDIDYLGSGYPCFDRRYLMELREEVKKREPLRVETPGPSSWSGEVKTWKDPTRGGIYLITADVAEGESRLTEGDPDWSVAHVYDCETWEQVCTYRSRCDTHAYAVDLAVLGEMYNYAELCVERTGPGLATLKTLAEDIGYPCIFGEHTQSGIIKHGFMMTAKSKKQCEEELGGILADMKEGFDGFLFNSTQTIDELIHFVTLESGRNEAERGWHDDETTNVKLAAVRLPQMTTRRKMLPQAPPEPKIAYSVGGGRGRR